MLNLCIAGLGRMGKAIIHEAVAKGHQISGVIEASSCPVVGKSLRELGVCNSETRLLSAEQIREALQNSDVFISFSAPAADLVNVPIAASMGKRIILGTTGFTSEQNKQVTAAMDGVPAVFSPNYSIGVNVLFKLAEQLRVFPAGYDVSLSEIHHTGKKDAPSGTARKIEQIISQARNYNKTVYGREGSSPRQTGELESVALRAGGVPGIHDIIVAGPNEMLRIEHTAFSRDVFAQGAVLAAEWISKQTQPKIYSMADVLGFA
jgi:4-hydroxy-tetrahydrodipicolinate reductase